MPLLCDRLAFLLGGAKDDMIPKWDTMTPQKTKLWQGSYDFANCVSPIYTCKAWMRGRETGIRLSPQTFSGFFVRFKMEDDSPVIYGLELNVSSQFIGLPFALQTKFVNNFKGLSSIKKLLTQGS